MEESKMCNLDLFSLTAEQAKIAGGLLSACGRDALKEQVRAIMNHPNQDDLIDYVDNVAVWEGIEHSMTVGEFLDMIPWTKTISAKTSVERNSEIIEQFREHDEEWGYGVGHDIAAIRACDYTNESNSTKVGQILVVLATAGLLDGDINNLDTSLFDFVD